MDNSKAKVIFGLGIVVIIAGTICGLILGGANKMEPYNWGITLGFIIGSIISGTVLIGFSEAIELLQQNLFATKKLIAQAEGPKGKETGSSSKLFNDSRKS